MTNELGIANGTGTVDVNYVAVPGHFVAESGDEAVVLHRELGIYFGLNPLAKFLWTHLQAPIKARQLADIVVAEYDVDLATATKDVQSFLEEMANAGLVNCGA